MAKHPAELLFEKGLKRIGASCGTLYVRDTIWRQDMRLMYMPGVTVTEPMYGFLIPKSSRELITQGANEEYFNHSEPVFGDPWEEDSVLRSLFGGFATRESLVSTARLIHRVDGNVEATMFANYRDKVRFAPDLRAELRELFADVVECLPSIYRNLKTTSPFPVAEFVRVLEPFETLSGMFHGATSTSLESYLDKVLAAAMAACNVTYETGFGTVYLHDDETRTLRLSTCTGTMDRSPPRSISLDRRHGIVTWVALQRRPLFIMDLASSRFLRIHISARDNTVWQMAVPMTADDEVIGVFNIESTQAFCHESPGDLVRVVSYAANLAAVACRLATEKDNATIAATRANRHARLSSDLLKVCSNVPNLRAEKYPLDGVARVASDFLKANRCDIWKLNAVAGSFSGAGADYAGSCLDDPPRRGGFSDYVLQMRTPVWISNITDVRSFLVHVWKADEGRWISPPAEPSHPDSINERLIEQHQIGSELGLPILLGDEAVGVAWVKYANREHPRPTGDVVSLANGFAGEASLVLASLARQEQQGVVSQTEGIELIVKMLRHDMPDRFLGSVIDRMSATEEVDTFVRQRSTWIAQLSLLRSFIENLRLYTPPSSANVAPILPEPTIVSSRIADIIDEAALLNDILREFPTVDNKVAKSMIASVDTTLMKLVFFTLLNNSKRFTPKERWDKPILVSASTNDGCATITIQDEGYGINDDVIGVIGTRGGVRASPKDQGVSLSGMGFGAYLCRLLVKNVHNGDITWENRGDGKLGAIVRVSLPSEKY